RSTTRRGLIRPRKGPENSRSPRSHRPARGGGLSLLGTLMPWILLSFGVCLAAFVVIGAWSVKHARSTTDDYLLAGRSVSPWLTALSSVATNNSGFMFIGLIGYAYLSGFE